MITTPVSNSRNRGLLLIIASLCFLLPLNIHAAEPTKEDFDKVLRNLWNEKTKSDLKFRKSPTTQCLPLPTTPRPDARSKVSRSPSWHLDFALEGTTEDKLRKFEVLTAVGLLEREDTTATINGKNTPVARYRLTNEGWATSLYSKSETCFYYGQTKYLGISRFNLAPGNTETKNYVVYAKVGLPSESDLAPWAKQPIIQTEFPEIKKQLEGREYGVILTQKNGQWVENSPNPQATIPLVITQNFQPKPDIADIKASLRKSFGESKNKYGINLSSCLPLPGTERFPVDKALHRRDPAHYAVAIFQDKERKSHDRVTNKTQPYLKMLEQIGVLTKTSQQINVVEKGVSTQHAAQVYELGPKYQDKISPNNPDYIPLGEQTLEFVDIQIFERKIFEQPPKPMFAFKLRLRFNNPSAVWKNKSVINGWPDLKGALLQGKVCEGEYEFDPITREAGTGGATCWWAFDSQEENN